jgi:hypothetical protein
VIIEGIAHVRPVEDEALDRSCLFDQNVLVGHGIGDDDAATF